MSQRPGDLWRRDPRPGALVVIFGVAAIGFLVLVGATLLMPAFVTFDEAVSEAIRSLQSSALEEVSLALTRLGDFAMMSLLTLVATLILWFTNRKPEAVLLAGTVALGTAIGYLFKEVFERARPGLEIARIPLPDSYSFPSGHALASFLFFATLTFIVMLEAKSVSTRIWVMIICGALAIGIALSRVYLGVHWFGDILASWMLGAAWMTGTVAAYFWLDRTVAPSSTEHE